MYIGHGFIFFCLHFTWHGVIYVLFSQCSAQSLPQAFNYQGILTLLHLDPQQLAHHSLHRLVYTLAHHLPDDLAYDVGGELPRHVDPATSLSPLLLPAQCWR